MNRTNGAFCKSCGAKIKFLRTKAGKWMPCDPETVSAEDLDAGDKLVTKDGDVLTVNGKTPEGYGAVGYVPHWATCKSPELFRR